MSDEQATAMVPLETEVKEALACLDKFKRYTGKAEDFRTAAGQHFASLKQRVRAGEPGHTNWKRFLRDHKADRSYRDINKCIRIAAARAQERTANQNVKAKELETNEKIGALCPTLPPPDASASPNATANPALTNGTATPYDDERSLPPSELGDAAGANGRACSTSASMCPTNPSTF